MKNTIELTWSILCSSSSVDIDTNNLTLSNIIDEITIPDVLFSERPANTDRVEINFNLQLVSLWSRFEQNSTDTDITAKIELIDPENKSLNTTEFNFKFPANKTRMRQRTNIPIIVITKPGIYNFRVSTKSEKGSDFKKNYDTPLIVNRGS
jgi:hypothetical protein